MAVARFKNALVHVVTFVFLVVLDLLTKAAAMSFLVGGAVRFGPFLNLRLGINTGVVWSFFSSSSELTSWISPLFLVICIVIVLFFIYFLYEFCRRGSAFPEVLVLSGGTANLIDRVLHGGVVDFIDLHVGSWHWAAFNVADVCIVVGVLLIAKRMLYEDL